jgi:hypothetical protein
MNAKSRIIVGRWTDATACSGVTASMAIRAMAPKSATPVRSSWRKGSPPRIIPR